MGRIPTRITKATTCHRWTRFRLRSFENLSYFRFFLQAWSQRKLESQSKSSAGTPKSSHRFDLCAYHGSAQPRWFPWKTELPRKEPGDRCGLGAVHGRRWPGEVDRMAVQFAQKNRWLASS